MDRTTRAADLFRLASQQVRGSRVRLLEGLQDDDPLVRHVAAIEVAKRWPGRLPESVVRELLETLASEMYLEGSPLRADYASATVTEEDCGSLDQDIVVAFAQLGFGRADYLIPRLLEFWSFSASFYELAHALVGLAFRRSRRPVPGARLSGRQRQILRALVAQSTIWGSDMSWPDTLHERGLPRTLSEMRRLLGHQH